MDSLDTITLLAFLAALMRLDNSLPADLQNQLNEIGKTFPSNVSKLHALAKSYSPLEQEYKDARLALQKDGERNRKAVPEPDESAQLSDEKIMNFAVEVLNADDSVNLVKKQAQEESSSLGQLSFGLPAIKRRRLREFYRALPATRPYPGEEVIRQEVGEQLARKILNEGIDERLAQLLEEREVEEEDEIIPPEELEESVAAWQDYLAGRDPGVSLEELKLKLFGKKA